MSVALQTRPHNTLPASVRCTVVKETGWCWTLQLATGCTTCSVTSKNNPSIKRKKKEESSYCYFIFALFSFIFVLHLHLRPAPSSSYCSFIFVLLLHHLLATLSSYCSFIFVLILHIRLVPSYFHLNPSYSSC